MLEFLIIWLPFFSWKTNKQNLKAAKLNERFLEVSVLTKGGLMWDCTCAKEDSVIWTGTKFISESDCSNGTRSSAICLVILLSMSNSCQILNLVISLLSQNWNSSLKANDCNAYVLGDVTCGGDKLMYSCCSICGNLAIGSIGVNGSTNSENSSGESSIGSGGRLCGLRTTTNNNNNEFSQYHPRGMERYLRSSEKKGCDICK